jgi:hypothetical protein
VRYSKGYYAGVQTGRSGQSHELGLEALVVILLQGLEVLLKLLCDSLLKGIRYSRKAAEVHTKVGNDGLKLALGKSRILRGSADSTVSETTQTTLGVVPSFDS